MTWQSLLAAGQASGAAPVTARCVRIATGAVQGPALRSVVVVQYRLDPGDGEVVIRGLLCAGWALVPAPVSGVVAAPDWPRRTGRVCG